MKLITKGIKVSPTCQYENITGKKTHTCEIFGCKEHEGKLYCNKHYRKLVKGAKNNEHDKPNEQGQGQGSNNGKGKGKHTNDSA